MTSQLSKRNDCGFPGITKEECAGKRGCSWDDTVLRRPWCLHDSLRWQIHHLERVEADLKRKFERCFRAFTAEQSLAEWAEVLADGQRWANGSSLSR